MTEYGKVFCAFTNSFDCFRTVTDEEAKLRFDGVTLLHTCPKGKALDKAANLCAGACYVVDERNQKPPEPPHGMGGPGTWPFGGY